MVDEWVRIAFEQIVNPETIATTIIFYLFARIILTGMDFALDYVRWKLGMPINQVTQVVNGVQRIPEESRRPFTTDK